MEEKTVLYLGGGMMSGVFGAGIVTGLQRANIDSSIKAIYGGSAGAFNGAYFLSHQAKLGSTIYYDDLPYRFFSWKKILKGKNNAIDRDFLMHVVEQEKKLNVEQIQKQRIPFYIKVLNKKTGKTEYIDGRRETFKRLRQAVGQFPFCNTENDRYIDGDILEPIGLDYLLEKHPKDKIVLALNYNPSFNFFGLIRDYYCGIIALSRSEECAQLRSYFFKRDKNYRRDMKRARGSDNILLVQPPSTSRTGSLTQDRNKLIETHKLGIQASKRILEFMKTGRK
ncbi:hypothetical protein HYT56_02745 [Candidatus Woesearchaeota archaeon]|nr:hypothetical protein [Candidatus Woesearchaeota archaeon]